VAAAGGGELDAGAAGDGEVDETAAVVDGG